MIRIAQFGSYNANVGDNIALLNIRKNINKLINEQVLWTNVCISNFHSHNRGVNNIDFAKRQFSEISKKNDLLIIGGGGLIETDLKHKNQTKWKLPFTEEILSKIKIPIVCFSLGINYFRNHPQLNYDAIKGLKHLKEKSSLFSLRNDGSLDIYENIFGEKCEEIPDPGLIFNCGEKVLLAKDKIKKGFFQPAWNNNKNQQQGRKYTNQNLSKMYSYCENNNLSVLPHTLKDYNFPYKNFIYKKDEFSNLVSFHNFENVIAQYYNYDYSIAMRGHGQLISIGLGLPSIYFSTQDKVRNFSLKNGFVNYNVDIDDENWLDLLQEKTSKLKNESSYLKEWYKIRNNFVLKCNKDFESFCKKTVEKIK